MIWFYHLASTKTNSTDEKKETEKFDVSSDDNELLKDLFVIQLPSEAKDGDLKEYFTTNCGELDLCEVCFGGGLFYWRTADLAPTCYKILDPHCLLEGSYEFIRFGN